MSTTRIGFAFLSLLVLSGFAAPIFAQENLLGNPEFTGEGGVVIGDMTLDSPVPDNWRVFAVGGSVGSFRTMPLAAGELFPDSPAVNAACLSISTFAGDYGFDHDFADNRVQLLGGPNYVGEFWVKSGNTDGSDQEFEVLFPIFNAAGEGLGAPGGLTGTATANWTKVSGPVFSDPNAATGFVRPRPTNDGGDENSLCVALPVVRLVPPSTNVLANPEFAGEGGPTVGAVTKLTEVPQNWRAFGVQGGEVEFEAVDLQAGEVFPDSPAARSACIDVTTFGNHGFDNDSPGTGADHFPLIANVEYHAEFWVKTFNADASDQAFNFNVFVFGGAGGPRGMSQIQGVATSEWQQFIGPSFSDPEANDGFVRWTVGDDGGPNGICIAFPGVFQDTVGALRPSELFCRRILTSVELTWMNNGVYDDIRILRDGVEIAQLDPGAQSFLDEGATPELHTYQVVAMAPGLSDGPSCEVNLVQIPVGTTVSVDLGEVDISDGLENTQRQANTDGENEFVLCGPDTDLREARRNLQDTGPNANPDNYLYFNVTVPDVKAQQAFIVTATVFDDTNLVGTGLRVQYTNNQARDRSDIPNVFFPLGGGDVQFLQGSGEWVELSWQIPDAGFRTFQQGSSDFRIHITDFTSRVCFDKVEVTFLPFPGNFSCSRSATGVDVSWSNPVEYDSISLLRDGVEIAALAGNETFFSDDQVGDGNHLYELVVEVDTFQTTVPCSISVFVVPPGTSVRVDLGGDVDLEEGLFNSQRGENTDGENEPVDCGPVDDVREARLNLADTDNDAVDNNYYFNVSDEAMKSQVEFTVKVTLFDAPEHAGLGLILQYTNSASTGPGDIPNTFFPLDGSTLQALEGTGQWVTIEWQIPDAGFRSFQQGSSDFRIGITSPGARVCIDQVEVVFGLAPPRPIFHRGDVNGDGTINIGDPIDKLNFLFLGGPAPPCRDAADADDDGDLVITGAIYLLNWLFLGGAPPPDPGPVADPCGPDPTPDDIVDADCVYDRC